MCNWGWGQWAWACGRSRWAREVLVDSGMTGMLPFAVQRVGPCAADFRAGSAGPSTFAGKRACACPPRTPDHADHRRTPSAQEARLLPYRGYQQVMRARIVLDAACGYSNAEIPGVERGRRHGAPVARPVRRDGIAGLADRRRSGRPPRFTPAQAAEVKALACSCQLKQGYRYRGGAAGPCWRDHRRGIAPAMSASTVRRILAADAIKPWQYRSWLFIRDSDFAAKATRVLDLYARVCDGSPLGDGEYVISSDEKTSIEARCRCRPTLPPGASRKMRVNHEYERGGALAYLAAYDVPAPA